MREDIYKVLKSRIVNLDYKPNESLTETALAREFEVSRTPIREIFIHLACEGLVTITPGNSIRIPDINLQGLQELINYRIILEKGAARLIGMNATEDDVQALSSLREVIDCAEKKGSIDDLVNCDILFHRILRKATHNCLLGNSLESVQLQFTRIQKLIGYKPDKVIFHLDTILESIRKKDLERIENCLVDHVYHFVGVIKRYFELI